MVLSRHHHRETLTTDRNWALPRRPQQLGKKVPCAPSSPKLFIFCTPQPASSMHLQYSAQENWFFLESQPQKKCCSAFSRWQDCKIFWPFANSKTHRCCFLQLWNGINLSEPLTEPWCPTLWKCKVGLRGVFTFQRRGRRLWDLCSYIEECVQVEIFSAHLLYSTYSIRLCASIWHLVATSVKCVPV